MTISQGFHFQCCHCELLRKSWAAMLRHLLKHPGHMFDGEAAVYVFPEEEIDP